VYLEDCLRSDKWESEEVTNPVDLKAGTAQLEVYVYRCVAKSKEKFYDLFWETEEYLPEPGWHGTGNDNVIAWYGTFDLGTVMAQPEEIGRKIEEIIMDKCIV
jgi:hypothetical protein